MAGKLSRYAIDLMIFLFLFFFLDFIFSSLFSCCDWPEMQVFQIIIIDFIFLSELAGMSQCEISFYFKCSILT